MNKSVAVTLFCWSAFKDIAVSFIGNKPHADAIHAFDPHLLFLKDSLSFVAVRN